MLKEKSNYLKKASDFMPKDRKTREILAKRAQILAQPIRKIKQGQTVPYIHFQIAENENYGIPYFPINEILAYTPLTKIPLQPAFVAGLVNRRGKLLSVLDLKQFFYPAEGKTFIETDDSAIIIVTIADSMFGILVERLVGNSSYLPAKLKQPLAASNINQDYLIGLDRGLIGILNMEVIKLNFQKNLAQAK